MCMCVEKCSRGGPDWYLTQLTHLSRFASNRDGSSDGACPLTHEEYTSLKEAVAEYLGGPGYGEAVQQWAPPLLTLAAEGGGSRLLSAMCSTWHHVQASLKILKAVLLGQTGAHANTIGKENCHEESVSVHMLASQQVLHVHPAWWSTALFPAE